METSHNMRSIKIKEPLQLLLIQSNVRLSGDTNRFIAALLLFPDKPAADDVT